MKGWIALTSHWKRPVLPERVEKPSKAPLLDKATRKRIYDMDLLVRETQEEIDKVFANAGLTRRQAIGQLSHIRRNGG